MSRHRKAIIRTHRREMARIEEITLRKHLNADALFNTMRTGFAGIRDHRAGNVSHTLADALMAGFAMFSIKDPSLLVFDERRYSGPHNLHYILCVKEGDHQFLFQYVDDAVARGEAMELTVSKQESSHLTHAFRVVYNAPLNKTHQNKRVTFVEYWEENSKTGKTQHFTWITDLTITEDNVFDFMRGARARWKIENETFNTLKNQGYHFDHNFGLGKKHLTEVFVLLMMLAFLIDQIQQLC